MRAAPAAKLRMVESCILKFVGGGRRCFLKMMYGMGVRRCDDEDVMMRDESSAPSTSRASSTIRSKSRDHKRPGSVAPSPFRDVKVRKSQHIHFISLMFFISSSYTCCVLLLITCVCCSSCSVCLAKSDC